MIEKIIEKILALSWIWSIIYNEIIMSLDS